MRFISFTFLLAACGTVSPPRSGGATVDTASPGGSYGYLPGSSDDGDDTVTEDTDSDTDTDTDSDSDSDSDTDTGSDTGTTDTEDTDSGTEDTGTDSDTDSDTGTDDSGTADTATEDLTVTAKVWIVPETTWDVSVSSPSTTNPTFSMWPVANLTVGDWAGYGTTVVATTSTNAYISDDVSYVPGETLVINGAWNDGINSRYFAEANGVVNAFELRVVIEFSDGVWQGYVISGSTPDEAGEAGWVSNGDSGGDVYVKTYSDTLDHPDL